MLKDILLKFFKLDGLIENLTGYVEARVELLKYEIKEDIARGMAKVAIILVLAMLFTLFTIFISTALALLIGEALNSVFLGFIIIAGVYFILLLLIVIFKDTLSHSIEKQIKKGFNHTKE